MANDMHFVLDMSSRTRYVLRTRKQGEYHIEIDRKGDYIDKTASVNAEAVLVKKKGRGIFIIFVLFLLTGNVF